MAVVGDWNIIQIRVAEIKTLASRSSGSWGEINGAYRVAIEPKRSDSKLLIVFNFTYSSNEEHRLQHWRIRNVTANSYVSEGTGANNREATTAASRASYNADNAEPLMISGWDNASATSTRTYGIWHKSHAGNQTNLNHSQSASDTGVHWTSTLIATIYEIEDI